jgi:hypothetical protein
MKAVVDRLGKYLALSIQMTNQPIQNYSYTESTSFVSDQVQTEMIDHTLHKKCRNIGAGDDNKNLDTTPRHIVDIPKERLL